MNALNDDRHSIVDETVGTLITNRRICLMKVIYNILIALDLGALFRIRCFAYEI